jgi:hypothetical protein
VKNKRQQTTSKDCENGGGGQVHCSVISGGRKLFSLRVQGPNVGTQGSDDDNAGFDVGNAKKMYQEECK